MRAYTIFLVTITFLWALVSCNAKPERSENMLALVGGTVLDFDDFGRSSLDIKNATVLIADNKIIKVGTKGEVVIPKGVKSIDVSGKFLIPGLIDAFATLNDQNYANAFLYMGVTTIVGLDGGRRGPIFWEANPAPEIYKFDSYYGEAIWSEEEQRILRWADDDQIEHAIDSIAATGVKVLLVHYGIRPDQLQTLVRKCKEHKMVTIGELGHSTIEDAIAAGIQSFVHVSRYSIDIVPKAIKHGYADKPFGKPRIRAYQYYEDFNPETDTVLGHQAKLIGNSNAGLIPTHGLWYPMYSFAKNPWQFPISKIIKEENIHLPLDKETGRWTVEKNSEKWDTLIWSQKLVKNLLKIERRYVQNGAKYLTGSGTDAFGTMPGISLHIELEMLHRAGLTNREALAAATTNFNKIWGWSHIGQIKEGSEADILVLEKNPVEDLSHLESLEFLIVNGETIPKDILLTSKN